MNRKPPKLTDNPEDVNEAREVALRILTHAPQPVQQVEQRLLERGFSTSCVNTVVTRLSEVGLLDDEKYAAMFVADRRDSAGKSRRVIQLELAKRGIAVDVATAALVAYPPEDEYEVAARLVAKKRRKTASHDSEQATGMDNDDSGAELRENRRLYSMLARRGFPDEVIRRALAV